MKLEYGKRYELRNGYTTDPMQPTGNITYPFSARIVETNQVTDWVADGAWLHSALSKGREYANDVIREIPDAPLQPPVHPDREAEYRRVFLEVAMLLYCNSAYSRGARDALKDGEIFINALREWDKKEGK